MHTWHIVPCVFFSYVVFSCNNLNNEVFILCGIIYPKRRIFAGKDTKKTPRHQINLGYIKRYKKLFHFLFYRFIFFDTFNSVGMNNSTGHLSAFSYRLEFYHKEIVYAIVTGEHIIILRDTILFTLHFGFGSVLKWLL